MTIEENWRNFVEITKTRCQLHIDTAWYWSTLHTILNITITVLTGIATLLSVVEKKIPYFTVPIIAGLAALVASVNAFLKPAEKFQGHHSVANTFNILMFKMIRCKNKEEYADLCRQLYEVKTTEPLLLKSSRRKLRTLQKLKWTVPHELMEAFGEDEMEYEDRIDGNSNIHTVRDDFDSDIEVGCC